MKRVFRIFITTALAISLTVFSTTYCFSEEVLGAKIFSGKSGVYLIQYKNKSVTVTKATPSQSSFTYSFTDKIYNCTMFNDTAYILVRNNSKANCAYLYTAVNGSLSKPKELNNIKLGITPAICADSKGNIYIKNSSGKTLVFNKSGDIIKTFDEKFIDIIPFKNYNLAYNAKRIYKLTDTSLTSLSNPSDSQLYKISENYLGDINGSVYKIGNTISKKLTVNKTGFFTVAETKKYLVSFYEDKLNVYNKTDYEQLSSASTGNDITAVSSYNNNVAVIYGSSNRYNCSLIPQSELDKNIESGSSSVSKGLNLSNYKHNQKYIYVKSKTTIAQFKSNITYDNYNISFGNRKSGYIRTNMDVTFTKDNHKTKYIFVVIGDVTGEGNVNSRDEAAVFKHLLGIEKLKGAFRLAGDLNGDNKISNADLVKLCRLEQASLN